MDNVDTKDLKIEVLGKEGYVQTNKIQKHMPTDGMRLIILENDYLLFCQGNHPLFVKRNDEVKEINAESVVYGDKIYVNNSIKNIGDNLTPKEPSKRIADIVRYLENSRYLETNGRYIKGSVDSYRLHPRFMEFDKEWLSEFFNHLNFTIQENSITSFNFLQQIRMICDKLNYNFTFTGIRFGKFHFRVKKINEELEFDIPNIDDYIMVKLTIPYDNYENPVYDIKTESSDFLCGMVQNHNSFHLGGSIDLNAVDIIGQFMDNVSDSYKARMEKSFSQKGDDLYLNVSHCRITIDKTIYNTNPYEVEKDYIKLPVGYFTVYVDDELDFKVNIELETVLYYSDLEETEDSITIIYGEKDKVLTIKSQAVDYTKFSEKMDAFVSGKSPFSDTSSLYMKFAKTFLLIENYDSVHIEILISNMLRAKQDPSVPARLKQPYTPITYSIKKLPGIISWPLGLAFENFGQAISVGLTSDRSPSSPIEKVMFGESLLEEKK